MNARAIVTHALEDIVMPRTLRERIIDRFEVLLIETLARGRRMARQTMRNRRRRRR